MQTNDELRDILLEKNENDGINSRKILLLVAAAIILFLVVVVVMKFINSDDLDTQKNTEMDSRLVLPPSPNEQNAIPKQTKTQSFDTQERVKNDEQLFEQVPIMSENKAQDDFEDMVKRLKDKSNTNQNTSQATQEKPTPIAKTEPSPVVKAVQEPKVEKKDEIVTIKETTKNVAAKKTETKVDKKAETKIQPKSQTAVNTTSKKGAYIQVAAVSKPTPDSGLVAKISAKGYSYSMIKVGNINKVVVGPFSEDKIQKALSDIRKDINKEAFIYRAK